MLSPGEVKIYKIHKNRLIINYELSITNHECYINNLLSPITYHS